MARPHVIKVPDVGEGIAEVELVAWHVAPGDLVVEDQALADVMTDKASVEIPSPVAGRVLALGGEVGQMLAVGAELIRIDTAAGAGGAAGEGQGQVQGEGQGARAAAPAVAAPAPAVAATAAPTFAAAAAPTSTPVAAAAPATASPAPLPAAPVTAPWPSASATAPGEAAPPTGQAPGSTPAMARPIASPALRRRAWELGVDLKDVSPSGAGGRIMQADLDAHLASQGARPPQAEAAAVSAAGAGRRGAAPPTAPTVLPTASIAPTALPGAPAAPAAPTVPTAPTVPRAPTAPVAASLAVPGAERHDEQALPVIGLRRRIAVQMQESKRRIPHFSYVEEIDVTELEALRAALNERWSAERGRLTLLPLLARAIVLAVGEFPQLNARFDDEAGIVTRHGAVHLGIATDTRHGLMVPVLRHAEARSVWGLAAELARLAEVARSGRATRAELSGSTITISSLGALGGVVSTPVINRPEVAIVGVNRIVERPTWREGAVVPRQLMNLSSSFDHRVVDGIDAARFVQALRARLEVPALLFAG